MSRKGLYRAGIIFVVAAATLLIGFLVWRYKIDRPVLIGREQAIQNAIRACNPSYGLRPVEQPTEFQTELVTYEEALGFAPIPSYSGRPVWVVKMKGRWMLVSGPAPAPDNPGPFYWDECTIVIDAQTGESLSTPIE